jgi:hypothetical protein
LLTTSIPWSEMVNVCGEVFETFAIVSVSPPSTVTVVGSKKKSFWSTVTVAAWPVPGPRIPAVTRAPIVISAITEGTQNCRAGFIPPLPFERSPLGAGQGTTSGGPVQFGLSPPAQSKSSGAGPGWL